MAAIDPGWRSFRITIFEDDINVALLLRYNLEARGYEVRCFSEGFRAIDQLRSDLPDAVILDWGLPGLSGIEVLRRMRACTSLWPVPVLMLTARCLPEDRQRAMDTGADAFLAKPFSVPEVIETLQRLIGMVTAQGPARLDEVLS